MSTPGPAPLAAPSAPSRSNRRRAIAALLVLLLVSAAMVYGTWLAVDDMRAQPMSARVTMAAGAVTVVNTSRFTWSDAVFIIDGTFRAAAPAAIAPGRLVVLPLGQFVDADGRPVPSSAPVREIAATSTRKARFRTFNVDHAATGLWRVE